MDTYQDLITQTFDFPNADFQVRDNELLFHDLDLMALVEKHGTPLRITYLPKISSQIRAGQKVVCRRHCQHRLHRLVFLCLLHQVVALSLYSR